MKWFGSMLWRGTEHGIYGWFGGLIPGILVFSLIMACENLTTPDLVKWPEGGNESKPWTRWWWMGNAVDHDNIRELLVEYHNRGIGGVEIACIYGAKGFEDRYLNYLDPEWRDALVYTIHVADSLGMGVDFTQGSGWPFGGPWVSKQEAASRMIVRQYSRSAGDRSPLLLETGDRRQSNLTPKWVVAQYADGQVVDLSDQVNENRVLHWTPETGKCKVFAIFEGKTGQRVKRAAPGGAGLVLDHFSEESVDNYLSVFDSAFADKIPGFRAFYNDSYEVYGADWTSALPGEFRERRGYDLVQNIPMLFDTTDSEVIRRVKSDFRETLNDLLLENFTQNWTKWAHDRGKITKNQAHGSPGNLIDIYGTVDIPECETFGSTYFPIPGLRRDSADIRNVDPDPIMLKFASSAANLTGKNLVSCETFTWLGEHFKSAYSQMKPEVDQVFLAGVNHVFYHGVTYSPRDVGWPGWLFYASLNLSPANSLWPHFGAFNDYVKNCQSILQSGYADNELLMYWPIYDIWNDSGDLLKLITVHGIDEWLHPTSFYKQAAQLMESGYSMDFISDDLIRHASAENGLVQTYTGHLGRKALVVPTCDFMPEATLHQLFHLAASGATIIFETKPGDVPGLHLLEERRASVDSMWNVLDFIAGADGIRKAKWGQGEIVIHADIQKVLESRGIKREQLVDSELKFIRRKNGETTYYFLVNHSDHIIDDWIPFNQSGAKVRLMDPLTCDIIRPPVRVVQEGIEVKLRLSSGQSLFVAIAEGQAEEPGVVPVDRVSLSTEQVLRGPWKLKFLAGGPELPRSRELSSLVSWTKLGDSLAEYFSGQAIYETTFEVQDSGDFVLDLGRVCESARIWINGQDAGYSWALPFELDVSDYIIPGENNLKIEVANLMANRIRYQDIVGIPWRNYHEINFVNIDYLPFDASTWEPMPSGLLGPVKLIRK